MLKDFDPVTLRLFVAVCEEMNIAAAAEREALVASAVSKRIAAIEREVGTPLLVRGRRGIFPTAAGESFLRQAREVIGALGRMRTELAEFATGVQGSIRVVASVSVLAGRLPEDIAAFLAKHAAESAKNNAPTSYVNWCADTSLARHHLAILTSKNGQIDASSGRKRAGNQAIRTPIGTTKL